MKLCDHCFESGDYVKATSQIIFEVTDERFDLCESCSGRLRDYIIKPKGLSRTTFRKIAHDRTRRTSEDVVETKE
jgi:hypothetical protein